jgi:hypothetical protein
VVPDHCRLALWSTWPIQAQWWKQPLRGWRYVTGGSWHKLGIGGVGYHWLGQDEPVLIYVKGSPPNTWDGLANAWDTTGEGASLPAGGHSEKPVGWLQHWLRRWTRPSDQVVELYAGTAPLGEACLLEGQRRYVGVEIDPQRIAQGQARLQAARERLDWRS